jgi:hypothetical protein
MGTKNKLRDTLLIHALAFLIFAPTVTAQVYNEGAYGAGEYGVFTEPTEPDDSCSKSDPKGDIKIKSVSPGDTHLKVRFSGMKEPYNKFQIKWGVSTHLNTNYIGNKEFGDDDTTTYTIEDLNPDTKYYIKIRAVNGCNKGNWSETVTARTLPVNTTIKTDVTDIKTTPRDYQPVNQNTETESPPSESSSPPNNIVADENLTYDLLVKVVDQNNEPISNAQVIIKKGNLTEFTNNEGTSIFRDLKEEQYEINVISNEQTGYAVINIDDPRVKEYEVNIRISPEVAKKIDNKIIIGAAVTGVSLLGFLAFKLLKK